CPGLAVGLGVTLGPKNALLLSKVALMSVLGVTMPAIYGYSLGKQL
ncbi:MAG: hypothetical protein JWP47_42, partial [Polaromonas sp.]|nr:hypothetical protein [Polaromonas sp.]